MAQTPFLVPNVLLLAVPLHGGGVLSPISPPVIRMAGSPFLRAVQAYLAIFGVRGDLLAVIIGAVPALAAGVAAYHLRRLIFGWLEAPLTVAASPFDHTGGCRILRDRRLSGGRFRNCYRVRTASWPMAVFVGYKTGGNAVVLFRRQQPTFTSVYQP